MTISPSATHTTRSGLPVTTPVCRFSNKSIPREVALGFMDYFPSQCEHNEAHKFAVNNCPWCGAPTCCPDCCAESREPREGEA